MGRTNKRERREPEERPLPHRERLERVPDFVPYVMWEPEPQVDDLPFTPALDTPEDYATVVAYLEVNHHEQVECAHHFKWDGLARFGYATCAHCNVVGWCKFWVKAGLYGLEAALDEDEMDETYYWIALQESQWQERI